jgi:hypothetical protein
MNKVHPELQEGEVFLMNTSDEPIPILLGMVGGICPVFKRDIKSGWESIGWKTKRRGKMAYDANNIPIAGEFPVFVQRKELLARGIDPDKLLQKKYKL